MSDVQVLTVEEGNIALHPNQSMFQRFSTIAQKSSTGCMIILQIVTLVLFAYTFYELSIVKAQVQPTLNYVTKNINITKLGKTLETGELLIDTVENDLLPDYYSVRPVLQQLPYFINETETFIKQIRAAIGRFLPPSATPASGIDAVFVEKCVC